jgi:putative MATE family efflux protein
MEVAVSLTEGPIGRRLMELALPILYTQVLQTLNGSINSIWVGHYIGEAALAASSNANVVIALLIGAGFGIIMAATILVGQCIGAGDPREARRVVAMTTMFFAALSIVMGISGWALSEPLLVAIKTPADSLPLAVAYIRVIFLALPCVYVYSFVTSVLNGTGDSKTPFYFTVLSVALDICLNPVLIFGAGPFPKLGIAGSALATLLAQGVSLVALVCHLYRRNHLLCLRRGDPEILRVNWRMVGNLVRKGVPMGAQSLVSSLGFLLMYALVNRFGVDTAAAFGASVQLLIYIQMPAIAIGIAVSAMVAHSVGAQKRDRIHLIARTGVVYSVLLTGLIVLTIEILDHQAPALFLPADSHALHIASHIIHIAVWSTVFLSILLVLLGAMSATGAVMAPLLIQTVAFLLVRFPVAEALLHSSHPDAIWWSFPVSSAIGLVLAVLYYKYGSWRMGKRLFSPGRE